MKKNILPLLFVAVVCSISMINVNNEQTTKKSFADLTIEEKQEAFTYMISTGSCEWKGIKLNGKVQFVDNFADIKIQYVNSFPDIKVKFVDNFPDDCGEWKKVSNFPDFKVQEVSSFPDLKVQEVSSFPGMK